MENSEHCIWYGVKLDDEEIDQLCRRFSPDNTTPLETAINPRIRTQGFRILKAKRSLCWILVGSESSPIARESEKGVTFAELQRVVARGPGIEDFARVLTSWNLIPRTPTFLVERVH